VAAGAQKYARELSGTSDAAIRARFRAHAYPTRATLPEVLALAREAATRSLALTPFPVQIMAAAALFDGVIADMKTGEGKTLVIGLAAALAALSGKGAHVATPNPYLAARDTSAMRPLYEFLGLSVGVTLPGQSLAEKQAAYACDIVYGVHSEFGFDYLRDHLVARPTQRVQRELHFVIVDEADSILIDEARTPLILTEPSSEHLAVVYVCDRIAKGLRNPQDLTVDPKERTVHLTESGFAHVALELAAAALIADEKTLYRPDHLYLMRYVEAALRARFVYQQDRDYLIHNGEVLIVDEATGRTLTGRRWQGGVHQAIEVAHGLPLQPESETVAEITYQSYFGLYTHLAGLTGTALGAAQEFEDLYDRGTIPIRTHRPLIRDDAPDQLYSDRAGKFLAIVEEVHARHRRGQPVLMGTASVEESEALARWFTWAKLPYRVLNARQNAEEASIIRDAGALGAITIATNMAGRGTDIVLGGHPEPTAQWAQAEKAVIAEGGLHIIGTQRNESRRVDDQLIGRAGRQGNPGSSRFYLSLEDPLLRVFGANDLVRLGQILAGPQKDYVESPLINKAVRKAQISMEALSFGARQQLVKTDRIIACQRTEVYGLREMILEGDYAAEAIEDLLHRAIDRTIEEFCQGETPLAAEDLAMLAATLEATYHLEALPSLASDELPALKESVSDRVIAEYRAARGATGPALTERERLSLLTALDRAWREHLTLLDSIRDGMHLQSYAQQNPDHVFAKDARAAFDAFVLDYDARAVALLTAKLHSPHDSTALLAQAPAARPLSRIAPCPCGSRRRFKHCHGQLPARPQLAKAG
jgi:preprotein translocase subunit SecA